ncbi:MAG: cytochrome c oxidase subunit 3 [Rickettsiaceae bacterium]|nr:MAG: cytochrome c oxidase subunit 3 [Rickettsiaceae bacterium]
MQQKHSFHLVPLSPLPVITSLAMLLLTSGGVMLMHKYVAGEYVTGAGVAILFACLYMWWHNIINEGDTHHTEQVRAGLRIGMGLFIISEMMFFFAFFFAYFRSSIFPVGILDGVWVIKNGIWPPVGIETFDPWDVPFINTLILLLSGTTVTWAHYAMEENNQKDCATALGVTVILGILFSMMQAYEYYHASFKLKDGIYAANFYLATGFHGLHVMIGTIFLAVCYFRAKNQGFANNKGHLGLEFAAWYWHFVDVVWLFLFAFVYVWGK